MKCIDVIRSLIVLSVDGINPVLQSIFFFDANSRIHLARFTFYKAADGHRLRKNNTQ